MIVIPIVLAFRVNKDIYGSGGIFDDVYAKKLDGEELMELIDCADGSKGHFCIRKIVDGTAWYYNKGKWCAFAQVFTAEEIIMKLIKDDAMVCPLQIII